MGFLAGSLMAIYSLWNEAPEPATVQAVAKAAVSRYRTLEAFESKEVMPRLQESGLYEQRPSRFLKLFPVTKPVLTPRGVAARSMLEGRLVRVLRQLQIEKPYWAGRDPRKRLLMALLCASGPARPAAARAALDSVPTDLGADESGAPGPSFHLRFGDVYWHDATNIDRLDWNMLDSMNRDLDTLDAAVDSDGGSDFGDGGSDFGGGDSGGGE